MCEHKQFSAAVKVFRLTETDDSEKVTGYTTDIKIKCAECGEDFEFLGVPGGVDPSRPTASADNLTLRAPIIPSTKPVVKRPGITYH